MSITITEKLSSIIWTFCVQIARPLRVPRYCRALLAGLLLFMASPLYAQNFVPSITIGGGLQTNYDYDKTSGDPGANQFAVGHARLYLSGDVTSYFSIMVNTDYNSLTNNLVLLDAVGKFQPSPKFNLWFGRFLPPSDRANLYGPFYSNQWAIFTDGIQDGYPSVNGGRDNGVAYWGDFKADFVKIKVSTGVFDGASVNNGDTHFIWAGRAQIDFWDPEEGYYQNGTFYGEKNILAISGATQVQSGHTATTVDFLMERKVKGGGAWTIESEYSNYNRLGGYDVNYPKSQGAYGLASFLIPKQVGIGYFEILGKYAIAQFTDGGIFHPSYRQNTAEVDFSYIIKQFDARVMSFYRDTRFNAVRPDDWQIGVGLQLQISKKFSLGSN